MMWKKLCVMFVLAVAFAHAASAQKVTPTPGPEDDYSDITEAYQDYSGEVDDAESLIEGLSGIGLIEGDGELLFTTHTATEFLGDSGHGEATYVNYAMGALTSVRELPDGTLGICTFITRGIGNIEGGIEQAVGVILTSDDQIRILELVPNRSTPRTTSADYPESGSATLYSPHYVLVVVKDDTVSVWIDAQLYIDSWELENELPEDGEYAEPVLTTVNPEPGCVMTSLWGYGF
ncbi:MAG: hypothetical protein IH587_10085 [Anaerolineae bacterium]|nr:hypothetical protein [Anaerolineae bacterium]